MIGPGKYAMLEQTLNEEMQDKYLNKYQGAYKSLTEFGSMSKCFGKCVSSVDDVSLNPAEKNWMRECYFKRINARSDFQYFIVQLVAKKKADMATLSDAS